MTKKRTVTHNGPAIRLAAAVALVAASACAAPIGAAGTGVGEAAPVRCGIATETHAGATAFRPWVAVAEGQVGSYRFVLEGAGAMLDQEGDFEAGANRVVTLSEALLSGPARAYAAKLTVTLGGVDYACRTGADDI